MHRQWMGLSVSVDSVSVEPLPSPPHPAAPLFIQDIALEIGFLRRGLEIAEQFSADDMALTFIKAFTGVLFSVGEIFVFEFHGQNLKAVVKSLAVLELADEQWRGGARGGAHAASPQDLGIIMAKTDVTFMKDQHSSIKIKSSAKRSDHSVTEPNRLLSIN